MAIHAGSWLGLPDLGISEKIGDVFNRPRDNRGGSQVFGSSNAQVLGNSTSQLPQYSTYQAPQYSTLAQAPSGGSSSGLPYANPSNQWQTDQNNAFNQMQGAAQSNNDAELSGLNSQYDYLASQAQNQLGYLGEQRQQGLGTLDTALQDVNRTVDKARYNTQVNTEDQIRQAGSTARNTQLKNRQTLRALGILNSSFAGENLNAPMNQFDEQRAGLMQEGSRRLAELDDFVTTKTDEHANLVAQLENQYAQLIGGIQTDMRFNERDRKDAIKAVNASLSSKLANIGLEQQNLANTVQAQKLQIATQLALVNGYTMPKADVQSILGTYLNAPAQGYQSQTASIYEDPTKKRLATA